jgi:hypothetical protein
VAPPELQDPDWLRRAYQWRGDLAIAAELGCDRKTVRAARERLGIASAPRGPRRDAPVMRSTPAAARSTLAPGVLENATAALIAERLTSESRPGGPVPSLGLLVARIRALAAADAQGDDLAGSDALIGIVSACGLIYEHRQRLRAAGWIPGADD